VASRASHPLAERRNVVGLSQEALAEALRIDRTTVGRWERRETEPRPFQRPRLAKVLQLSLEELGHLLAAARDPDRLTAPDLACSWRHDSLLLESPERILERIQRQRSVPVTEEYLNGLRVYVDDVADRYELEGPAALAPEILRQRLRAQDLLFDCPPSKRGLQLMNFAARLSALLSYMAVNLGQFGPAQAYATEAFQLADETDDGDLMAWVRGTQSLAAYYTKRYDRSAEFARDGLRYAHDGPQAVRLLVNGEARALAKLGATAAAQAAVSRSYKLLERFAPEPGMSGCISFGLYSEARVASNAATAFLSMSKPTEALAHAEYAQTVIDESNSMWSRALVRLDAATARLSGTAPDLDHAALLVREVRGLTHTHDIESIRQRTVTCLDAMRPWRDAAAVKDLLDEMDTRANEP
jgi:transcriptional regulator with XRE-family HTH domain